MVYCVICENEFPEEIMKQVISKGGIVKVCPGCFREEMPLFKKPEGYQFEGIYKRKSVYERLSNAAGLKNPEEHRKRISEFGKSSGVVGDESLRKIVNKNFEEKAKKYPKNEDLIDNFHWVIMRARRSMKISQKQLAEELKEPESAISMAEKGFISQGNDSFVRKIEQFLRIRISKKSYENAFNKVYDEDAEKKKLLEKFKEIGELDDEMTKNLTISDLHDLKEKKKKKWWQFGKNNTSDLEEDNVDVEYEKTDKEF
jgi:ribosome-binding protein aMBF1 (putative translation factor)